jgi:hypothetical protein
VGVPVLDDRAHAIRAALGGNAIVNIRSNYKNVEFSSETEYECGAGNVTGGTVFVGDVVKLP